MKHHQFVKSFLMAAGVAVLSVGLAGGASAQVGGRPEPVGKTAKPRTDEPMNPAKNAAAMKSLKNKDAKGKPIKKMDTKKPMMDK